MKGSPEVGLVSALQPATDSPACGERRSPDCLAATRDEVPGRRRKVGNPRTERRPGFGGRDVTEERPRELDVALASPSLVGDLANGDLANLVGANGRRFRAALPRREQALSGDIRQVQGGGRDAIEVDGRGSIRCHELLVKSCSCTATPAALSTLGIEPPEGIEHGAFPLSV